MTHKNTNQNLLSYFISPTSSYLIMKHSPQREKQWIFDHEQINRWNGISEGRRLVQVGTSWYYDFLSWFVSKKVWRIQQQWIFCKFTCLRDWLCNSFQCYLVIRLAALLAVILWIIVFCLCAGGDDDNESIETSIKQCFYKKFEASPDLNVKYGLNFEAHKMR